MNRNGIATMASRIASLEKAIRSNMDGDRSPMHLQESAAFDLRCQLEEASTASIREAMQSAIAGGRAVLEDELTRRAYAGQL